MGGSATDEIALIDELESLGGLVVADSFCFGGRIFRETVPGDNVIERLAKTYLYNLRCPRMFEQYARRKDFIVDMIKRSKADGAVFFHNKFCDLHGIENVKLRIDLEQEESRYCSWRKNTGPRPISVGLKPASRLSWRE